MIVYYARHGESLGNRDGYVMGQDDIELTDKGRQQARDLGNQLQEFDIECIVTSPLVRASETAEIIARKIKYDKKIVKDKRLRERHMGQWQKRSSGEMRTKLDEVGEEEFQKIGDIESLESLRDRAEDFLRWLDEQADTRILVVGHHAYSKMLRAVIINPKNYKEAFVQPLSRIETGGYVRLEIN